MLKKVVNILVAFSLILLVGCASTSKMDVSDASKLDRTKAPEAGNPKPVVFPKFQEATLSNGLDLIVIENNKLPMVFISFTLRGGSYFDGDKIGVSSLTSTLLTKGTTNRTAMEIANEVDFLGSDLGSTSTWDANRLTIRTLKKNLSQSTDILVDCLLNPTFAEDELKREVTQRLAGIKQGKTEPNNLAEIQFAKVIFGETPYGNPSTGTETSLNNITVTDLKAFYKKYFLPNNSFCVISGDITLNEAVALLEEKLKDWKKGEDVKKDIVTAELPSKPRVVVVDRMGAVQSAIRVGSVGMDRTNPDYFKLSTLNTYLGGYFRAQLTQKLREEKSYTYGVSSGFDARLFPGPFAVRTSVGSEVTALAIDDIFEEIKKVSTTLIADDRFNEVKNYIMGSFPTGIQTNMQVASAVSNLKLYGLPMNYYDNYISSIQKITKEDLKQVAEKYLDVSKMSIVISGDNETIAPTLEKFGTVESVDADGRVLR